MLMMIPYKKNHGEEFPLIRAIMNPTMRILFELTAKHPYVGVSCTDCVVGSPVQPHTYLYMSDLSNFSAAQYNRKRISIT